MAKIKPERTKAIDDIMGGWVEKERMRYEELGFDTLPVVGGGKKPIAPAWQSRLPFRLWQHAPDDANIGIRGGGFASVAFIDCDESRTFETVTNWLGGLGYINDSYPVVQTASGEGRHVYVTIAGDLSGDARKLSSDFGSGEFRYGAGAMVVAPPSFVIGGGTYTLLSGDFSVRPTLEIKDILPILGNQDITPARKPKMSRKAAALLHGKFEVINDYQSDSEAEQALIASLINSGFAFGDVLDLFNRHPCAGKYAELRAKNARNAERWLRRSFDEAEIWTKANESKVRQIARSAYAWAESKPWKGRTGAIDQLVYLAHVYIAHRAGRLVYGAGRREIAELTGINQVTATNSTKRLMKSGLIIFDTSHTVDCATLYRLGNLDKLNHSLRTSNVRKWLNLSHDVFRHGGLGKSAGQVWQVLLQNPSNIDELAEATGRHPKTIKRAIKRMSNIVDPLTGECLPMIASENGKTYHALSVDLNQIARAVGTAGKGERQRIEHARERRLHSMNLLRRYKSEEDQQTTSGGKEKV